MGQVVRRSAAVGMIRVVLSLGVTTRARAALWLALIALASCSGPATEESDTPPDLGTVAQALVDGDNDGLDDNWESANFGSLSQTGAGDFDSDGMTNAEEYAYGFNPTIADAMNDQDQDRFPNIFELRNGSNPTSATSTPTAPLVVKRRGWWDAHDHRRGGECGSLADR